MNTHDIELFSEIRAAVQRACNYEVTVLKASEEIQAAIEADRKHRFENGKALRRYKECGGDEEKGPIERLRFYCSLAMSGQDWLDVQPFFDDLEADRQRSGDNNTGRNDATQDALNKVADVFCMDPDELDDPYTVVSAAKDFFANWELDRKNWDRKRRGEPVAWLVRDDMLGTWLFRSEKPEPGLWKYVKPLYDAPQPAEPVCTCKTHALGVVHRTDGPCFHYEPKPAEPVAYLDLGVGGYMDVGTDLTDEQLAALPKGRHMLAIVGTYGVDGYTEADPQPAEPVKVPSDKDLLDMWDEIAGSGKSDEALEFAYALLDRYGQQAQPTSCQNESMGEHACSDRSQCWEPCGELGKSEEHARVYDPPVTEQEEEAWNEMEKKQ